MPAKGDRTPEQHRFAARGHSYREGPALRRSGPCRRSVTEHLSGVGSRPGPLLQGGFGAA